MQLREPSMPTVTTGTFSVIQTLQKKIHLRVCTILHGNLLIGSLVNMRECRNCTEQLIYERA